MIQTLVLWLLTAQIPIGGDPGLGDVLFPHLGNSGYDVAAYDLDLNVDPEAAELRARVEIRATANATLGSFHLDFRGLVIDDLQVDGAPAKFTQLARELRVEPEAPIQEGAEFQVAVRYHGWPEPVSSKGIPLAKIGWLTYYDEVFVLSEPEGAATWFPCNDHPADKARFSFAITVPEPYSAAANGVLVSTTENDDTRTFRFEARDPMATYLATVGVAEFDIVRSRAGDLQMFSYLPVGTRDHYEDEIAFTAELLHFFSERFGPYPFESCGAIVAEIDIPGALETQTVPTYASIAYTRPVIAHELAHQWFGNSVSVRQWRDIWLAEGFASLAMWLLKERDGGEPAYRRAVRSEHATARMLKVGPPADPDPYDLFGAAVYTRGGLALHALRVEVGDEVFFDILRRWTAKYRHGNATTQDFIDHASSVAGRDLADCLNPWLFDRYVPDLPD